MSPRPRVLRTLALTLALGLAVLTGCSAGSGGNAAPGAPKTLRFVTVYPANTTDPQLVHTAFILNSGTTETLVGLDPHSLKLYPWLAESWETEDAQHWTFRIRQGVTFHNGAPLDAEAVRAALQHALDVNPGVVAALKIDSMTVVDDHTLSIATTSVYPALVSNLVHYNTVITDVTDTGDVPMGTGAFRFESFDPAGRSVLVRNDQYWDGRAKLDRVVMTANEDSNARMLALQAGDADIIYRPSLESIPTLRADPAITVDSVTGTRVYHLQFNYVGRHAALWNNRDFRRGIDALVDRQSIVDGIMAGQGTVAFNPFPGDWPFSPTPLGRAHGTEAALQHFKAAGLEVNDGKVTHDGKPLTMQIVTYIARPELPLIAQLLRESAAQVGITLNIQVAENIDEYLPKTDFDIATYSVLTISRGDGAFFLNGAFGKGGAQNHGRLADPALLAKLDAYNTEIDPATRIRMIKEIGGYIEEQQFNSYLVVPNETAAYRNGVTGWLTPGNEFEFPMITKDLDLA
ncbi:MAG: ABC transporter substrate-binding protein [Nigerium sp.]|nr:ABC transporter substrate-binding protein [Nigerium sp.]